MLKWEEFDEEMEVEDAAWDVLVERYDCRVRAKNDLDNIRSARGKIEATGVCWLLAEWLEDEGYANARDVYDDLSCDRGGRWDLGDDIDIGDGLEVGAVVLNGVEAYAEVWSDDNIVGYVVI